jgi:DNA-binding NtrC family response regulator
MGEPYAGLVLVVDDDAALRHAMKEYLMKSGCAVLEARDTYDGLFLCAQYGHALNLMITEINLLPVSGVKLAESALRLWPKIQVVCTAANADMRGVQYWMNYLHADFLPKPFTPAQLHQLVFGLLGKREESQASAPHAQEPHTQHQAFPAQPSRPALPAQLSLPPRPPLTPFPSDASGSEPGQAVRGPAENNARNPLFWLTEF